MESQEGTTGTVSKDVLTYERLREAVAGGANYLRIKTDLQPSDGPRGKVHPPTYSIPEGSRSPHKSRYHMEHRHTEDSDTEVPVVILDSVASQANRAEIALLQAYQEGNIRFPFIEADFGDAYHGVRPGRLTSLEASHRAADATFRECSLDGKSFRQSSVGRAIFESDSLDAEGVYRYSPLSLVFGQWDSHGGDAVRGHKLARVILSEIVGIDAVVGRKTASKLDPLKVESAKVFEATDGGWTTDPDEAVKDKKGPREFGKGEGRGRLSGLGIGNVTPSLDPEGTLDISGSGGVTFKRAEQSTVIALNGIRQLRFPHNPTAAVEAQTAIAALALAGAVFRDRDGFALRSRCWLVPLRPPTVELVDRYNQVTAYAPLSEEEVAKIVEASAKTALGAGIGWNKEPILLKPSHKLLKVVRRRKQQPGDEPDAS